MPFLQVFLIAWNFHRVKVGKKLRLTRNWICVPGVVTWQESRWRRYLRPATSEKVATGTPTRYSRSESYAVTHFTYCFSAALIFALLLQFSLLADDVLVGVHAGDDASVWRRTTEQLCYVAYHWLHWILWNTLLDNESKFVVTLCLVTFSI